MSEASRQSEFLEKARRIPSRLLIAAAGLVAATCAFGRLAVNANAQDKKETERIGVVPVVNLKPFIVFGGADRAASIMISAIFRPQRRILDSPAA